MAFHRGYDLSDMNSPENKGVRYVFQNTVTLDLSPMTTRGITELHIVAVDKVLTAHETIKYVANKADNTLEELNTAFEAYKSAYEYAEFIHNALNARHKYTVLELPAFGKWITHLINDF
jgi:hypothetical protein